MNRLSILYAVPDHPWVDAGDGADVRIAMSVAERGTARGIVDKVMAEVESEIDAVSDFARRTGMVHADFTVGANVSEAQRLQSNIGLSFMGVTLIGDGFRVSVDDAVSLGFDLTSLPRVVRPYVAGKELTQVSRNRLVIDLYDLPAQEVRSAYPTLYQWLIERVKPQRDQNKRQVYRDKWWIFGEPRGRLRRALSSLRRYIATLETSKHRLFVFLDGDVIPDHTLFAVAIDDGFALGVLSSNVHVTWALAAGSRLGVGNDPRWRNVTCFEPFPFPACTEGQKQRIRELGEALDGHRKRQQGLYPELTLTEMYNVLEKLRKGEALTAKEKKIHEEGLVGVLKQIHDELDAAVFEAYGWPADLSDEQILERLVALNAERHAEEERGLVRWLRPEFQAAGGKGQGGEQGRLGLAEGKGGKKGKEEKGLWPGTLAEQAKAVRGVLAGVGRPVTVGEVAKRFRRAKMERVEELVGALVSLGQAREVGGGRYVA